MAKNGEISKSLDPIHHRLISPFLTFFTIANPSYMHLNIMTVVEIYFIHFNFC